MDLSKGKTYVTSICYPLQACFQKIIGVLARNGGGNWNQYYSCVGSMSLLHMALVCIHVGLGTSHLVICLPSWVWVISFDRSSYLFHVTMTSDPLMSKNSKSSVVSLICSREVGLCRFRPPSDSLPIFIHKTSYSSVSRR